MSELLPVLLFAAFAVGLIVTILWAADHVLGKDPAPKDKPDLTYNPLAQDWDVNIPNYPGMTPEKRQHMSDVLTGVKPPGPDDRLVTIEGAEIEKILKDAGAPRKQDLRYNPLSTDDDICMPVRPRPPSLCLVCGDPMKQEQGVETCDCAQRGYQPRS
jgi:hypothetical protein